VPTGSEELTEIHERRMKKEEAITIDLHKPMVISA
jgi:hypothetical protein